MEKHFPDKRIIVFEGLDNCFKETNYKVFVDYLRSLFNDPKYSIKTESFPRYGNQSTIMLEKWLDGSLDRGMLKEYPWAVDSLYSIDRLSYWYESVHGTAPNIELLLEDTDPVCFVFDRYSFSNAIYNPISKSSTELEDVAFDAEHFGIPEANVIIWMRCGSLPKFIDLVSSKSGKDMNERDIKFLTDVWNRSEKAITNQKIRAIIPNLYIVNILNSFEELRSKEDIASEIRTIVDDIVFRKPDFDYMPY